MHPQPEPNVRRKKHYRARGSRGGSRRKKQFAAQTQAREQAKQAHFYENQNLHHQYLVEQQIHHQQQIQPLRHSNMNEMNYLHVQGVQTYRESAMKLSRHDSNISNENYLGMPPPLVMSTSSSSNSEWSVACESEEETTPSKERYNHGIETLLSNISISQNDGRNLCTVGIFKAENQRPCLSSVNGDMDDKNTYSVTSNHADCNNHAISNESKERTFEAKRGWPFETGQINGTSLFVTSPKSFLMGKNNVDAIEKQRLDFSQ